MCITQGSHLDWKTDQGKSQEILNRREKSGKITQTIGKVGEFQKDFLKLFSKKKFKSHLILSVRKSGNHVIVNECRVLRRRSHLPSRSLCL